ncbi:MAG: hypothetical protein HY738_11120 [Bacteroidia bacterium]|nr:hypothetical protein [Bacteroidia bacterium]
MDAQGLRIKELEEVIIRLKEKLNRKRFKILQIWGIIVGIIAAIIIICKFLFFMDISGKLENEFNNKIESFEKSVLAVNERQKDSIKMFKDTIKIQELLIKELRANSSNLISKVDSLNSELTDKREEINNLQNEINRLNANNENLKDSILILNNKVAELQSDTLRLFNRIIEVQEQINKIEEKYSGYNRGVKLYIEGLKYEKLGDTQKGLFKSKEKRIEYYQEALLYYERAENNGIEEAKEREAKMRELINELNR